MKKLTNKQAAEICFWSIQSAEESGEWMDWMPWRESQEWMKPWMTYVTQASNEVGGRMGGVLVQKDQAGAGDYLSVLGAMLQAPPSGAKQHAAFIEAFCRLVGGLDPREVVKEMIHFAEELTTN